MEVAVECVHVLSGVRHLTETCGKYLWNLYCVAHKNLCGVTHSCLVIYYPCCGDVDINQLKMYGY